MKALPYAFGFTASCIALAVVSAPSSYVIQTKEELGVVIQEYVDKKPISINPRSYSNMGLMGITGLLAVASLGLLVKELSDKPLITQPLTLPQPLTPVVFNNNNTVVNRSVAQPQKQQSYTPDLTDRNQDPHEWINGLHEVNCLLIYGEQGSGKTTFVEAEVKARQELGHEVIVLDPHRKYGAWDGLEVTGDGRDYRAIDEALLDLQQLIDNRYTRYSTVKDFEPKPITVICEEFTQWNDKCQNSDAFFSAALSDVRKVRIHVLFVAHGDTLGNLTKKSGMGKNRDLGMTKLELIGKASPTGKTVPSGKGNLYLQRNANTPIAVTVPDLRQQTEEVEEHELDMIFKQPIDNVIPLRRAL
jgi:energy-coupling factor transporter ATP-binding protein EcfA2